MKKIALTCLLYFLFSFSNASAVELAGRFIEGGMVVGQTQIGSIVTLDKVTLQLSPKGEFVFGFHRDAPESRTLTIILPDGTEHQQVITIENREYNIQAIDGLDQKKVTPPADVIARIQSDAKAVRATRVQSIPSPAFDQNWIWPATGIITGVYGAQRILNGTPRAPHYGIDIAIPEGTPVKAPAGGKVTLVKDLYYSGVTILIDHGMGIMSSFLHLKESTVQVGDRVSKGDVIALSGNTGRSTGAHLDWRVNWFNHARLDASLLVPAMEQ